MNVIEEQKKWLAFNQLYGVPYEEKLFLIKQFNQLSEWFFKTESFLVKQGLLPKTARQIQHLDWRKIEKDLEWLSYPNRNLVAINDPDYPSLLKEISCPPLVLFVEGEAAILNQKQLAMVGSRNPSPSGLETAEAFASELAMQGLIITSGLAMGIDAASHRGALKTGKTIAVLGTGLDVIYPSHNKLLAEEIVAGKGALIAEFSLGTQARKEHFPWRNRIISGLSVGVLVVEATLRSGSLITAKCAADQGREIFSIPGSIHNPLARGCHYLIRQGAKVVETTDDIFAEIKQFFKPNQKANQKRCALDEKTWPKKNQPLALDKAHQKLLSCTNFEVTAIDTLIARSGFSPEVISAMLLVLELQGYIKSVAGGYVRVTAEF